MKRIFVILILLILSSRCLAQNILDTIDPLFKGDLDGDLIRTRYVFSYNNSPIKPTPSTPPILVIGIFRSNALLTRSQAPHEKLPELEKWKQSDNGILELRQDGYYGLYPLPTFDSAGIIVTVNGINKQNVHNYEFRVVENKTKEIIRWRAVTLFCEPYLFSERLDGKEETEVAYLGKFRSSFGNSLTFEIRKKDDLDVVASLSAIWINRKPEVLGVFSGSDMRSFLSTFKRQWQDDNALRLTPEERAANDSNLILRNKFKAIENDLIFYLDDKIRSKEIIEYNLISGRKQSGWNANDFDLNMVWLKNLSPGKHKLQLRYSLQRHNVSEYEFAIEPAWHQTATFKIIAAILAISLVGFIVLLFRSRKQKQKLVREHLYKQQVEAELKSIHSQFNPHFVFNALSSIQALITKNDLTGANKYLSEFSTLLRDSLKNSGKEMVSLSLEIKMLDSYVQLEQLRFGFTYTIHVDESIDKNAIEIPVLLLQPLVENAVKHGISPLYDKGTLSIYFKKTIRDMLVIISDNGNGYDTNDTSGGFGLKLTRERIEILNKMLKEQSIGLSVNSSSKGTITQLLFKNWLV